VPEPARPEPAGPGRVSPRGGLGQAGAESFSLAASIGGVRGLLESVLPVTFFSVVYGFTRDLRTSILAALVPAVVLTGWRLLAREPLTQAVSGLLGVGIGAVVASRTGRAEDFILPSIIKNVAFALVYAVSILIRWPLVGVLVGQLLGEGLHWREVPERLRVYQQTSWIFVGVFVLRLAVQVPLWAAGAVTALGTANVFLGLPLFGLAVWVCWLILRRVPPAVPPEPEPEPEPISPSPRA
jgi:hypothetical protein